MLFTAPKKLALVESEALARVDEIRVRNATYRAAADIEIGIASRDLKEIALAGLLEPLSGGRGRYYKATQIIIDIRNRAREEKRALPDVLQRLELFSS